MFISVWVPGLSALMKLVVLSHVDCYCLCFFKTCDRSGIWESNAEESLIHPSRILI